MTVWLGTRRVLIRGDVNTGKTSLLRRLRGGTFVTEYEPSQVRHSLAAHIKDTARRTP